MATSWPTYTTSDYQADHAVTTPRAQLIRDRAQVFLRTPWNFSITDATASSQPFTIAPWMPGTTIKGRFLETFGSGGDVRFRLTTPAGDLTGPTVVYSASSAVVVEVEIDADTVIPFAVPLAGLQADEWVLHFERLTGFGTFTGGAAPNCWCED